MLPPPPPVPVSPPQQAGGCTVRTNTNGCRHHTLTQPPHRGIRKHYVLWTVANYGGIQHQDITSLITIYVSNLHCSCERRVIFAIEIAHISGTHGEISLLLVASSQPMHSVQIILRCSSGWICRYLAPAVDIWRPVVDISTHRE